MKSTISYAVTVCNEVEETKRLLNFLQKTINPEDEIVVLLDSPKCPNDLREFLHDFASKGWIKLKEDTFQKSFGNWKNKLLEMTTKDYIFQLDADEMITEELVRDLPHILYNNPNLDVLGIVRRNQVEGITPEHIKKWGWITSKGPEGELLINYPDTQLRIFKNNGKICWKKPVHEVLHGHESMSLLPEGYYLIHNKHIKKQEQQNELYNKFLF